MADKIEINMEKLERTIREVEKELDKAEEIAKKAMVNAMVDITFDLLGEGMRRAPKKTGHLRGSGIALVNREEVARTVMEGSANRLVKTSFGDFIKDTLNQILGEIVFNTNYAWVQHERTDFSHMDGEAKYLENPLKENAEHYVAYIAEKVKKELDKHA